MKSYRFWNNILGWTLFLISAAVYIATIEPTASFWDCGEYIATSYKLQVGHPPGAPTFQLIGRFFSMFAFDNVEKVAFMVNLLSAISSALTIMFLFWTITLLVKKIVLKGIDENEASLTQKLYIFGAGFVGALAYTFTDSFWFSAVEGEVYALSSFFTAVTFWAALKWEEEADKPNNMRWVIFIAYIVGLSIGVHLLNLLTLPALVFVYYYRRYSKITFKGVFWFLIVSVILLWLILYVIIPGVVILAGNFELFFVNVLRLPFNSGTIFYLALLVGLIAGGIYYARKKNKIVLDLILKSFMFLLIGYSTYFILVIRANAQTPINENDPSNAVNLLAYLQREQYGDTPLLYGPYYNAPMRPVEEWKDRSPIYKKDLKQRRYVIIDKREKSKPVYERKFCTVFPRMWSSSEQQHIEGYKQWANIKGVKIPYNRGGQTEMITKPTFGENLKFFFNYQVGFMYLRYFMWNFVGRQNDIQGHGNLTDGNWISGIKFIDARLGPQNNLPTYMKNNKGRNEYYFLPLILGILGLIYHINKNKRDAFVVTLLFFMTGIAITLYTNQTPFQPRERDYAYAASFYAFAIWIGIGVLSLADFFKKYLKQPNPSIVLSIILSTVLVPGILAKENWDDHDRSNRYTARDFAKNYLDSCAPNAILFTNGDNDTFPLWYVQEVEGYRTDVRVVNLSLLNTDWYVNMMKRAAYNGKPVPISLEEHQYQSGSLDVVYLIEEENNNTYVDLKDLFRVLREAPEALKYPAARGKVDYFPTKNFALSVDSAKVVANGTVRPEDAHLIVPRLEWRVNRNVLFKNAVMVFDILQANNWERPVYFAITTGDEAYMGLQDYFQIEGLAYRLVPIKTPAQPGNIGRIDTEIMYNNMMKKFKWGNVDKEDVYVDENIRRMCYNYRNNFARLADALIKENKKEKAIEVLDFIMKKLPENKLPYNYFVVPIADAYYKADEFEKGDKILDRLLDIMDEELKYYFSFRGSKAKFVNDEKEQCLGITQRIMQSAEKYKREKLQKKAEAIFKEYYPAFVGGWQQ